MSDLQRAFEEQLSTEIADILVLNDGLDLDQTVTAIMKTISGHLESIERAYECITEMSMYDAWFEDRFENGNFEEHEDDWEDVYDPDDYDEYYNEDNDEDVEYE